MYSLGIKLNLLIYRITGLEIFYLDDEGVQFMIKEVLLRVLKEQTTIANQVLSPLAASLLYNLSQSYTSFYIHRNKMKKYQPPENEDFDLFTHAYLNFIETMGNNF